MFDTMTMVKTVGALCGALLIFLLGSWFASAIYSEGGSHHAGGEHVQGYVIAVEGGASSAEPEPEISFEELLAMADAGKGERVFKKCTACHSVEPGVNMTGPTLASVVDRPVEAIDGFNYSGALHEAADQWVPENLFHFLEKPSGFAPGTTMGFAGLSKPEDRANLIAYLATL